MSRPQQRTRHGALVEEAPADYLLAYVTDEDRACGVRGNPCECALAQAIKRNLGPGTRAEILRSMAYVVMPNENGDLRCFRFRLSPASRRRVKEFDKTGQMHPGGVVLKAPTKTQTLEHRRGKPAKPVKRPNSRRVRTGEAIQLDDTVRNGSGHIHHGWVVEPNG